MTEQATRTNKLPVLGEHASVANRCGTCRVCCISLSIDDPKLSKAEGVPCSNLCDDGCGIYESRPNACRKYVCQWHLLNEKEEKFRPEKCNLLCFPFEFNLIGLATQVIELRGGASKAKTAVEWIEKLWSTTFPWIDGSQVQLPLCIIRYKPNIAIKLRPMTWIVSESRHQHALEILRHERSNALRRFRGSKNAPCPCGSGQRLKTCHARSLEIIVRH